MYELKPIQIDACKAAYQDLSTGVSSTLLVLATGVGKTVIASGLANRWVNNDSKRLLFLAHRDELLRQASEKFFNSRGLHTSLEKADAYAGMNDSIVIGSVQTMQGRRLERWPRDHFDIIITDEAHRSCAATYRAVYDWFDGAQRLGLTATAFRQKGSLSDIYEKISFEYGLRSAIKDGLLCPITAQTIPLEIDLTGIRSTDGDYSAEELAESIEPYIKEIALRVSEIAADRKIILFAPVRDTARLCQKIFADLGFRSYYCGGDDRSQVAAFEADGPGSIMCNSMLLTEGYDHPQIDCVVVLRPTKSTGLYLQMIGRGTRLFIGKKDCLVLDFLWNFATNNLCKPSCLIAESEEEANEINKILDSKGSPVDLVEEAQPEAVKNIQNERERALAKRLHECCNRKSKRFDPVVESLSVYDSTIPEYKPQFEWEKMPVTNGQIQYLKANGFRPDGWTKGYASKIIDGLVKRNSDGLCSPKQMRCLLSNGHVDAGRMSRDDASKAMEKLSVKWDRAKRYKRYKEMRKER
jgi:superfamily II DNA or RNA helicase